MTAALLDRAVARTLARNRIATASLKQRQNLAAIIHLCRGRAVTDTRAAASDSEATSDAATTTPGATLHGSTR